MLTLRPLPNNLNPSLKKILKFDKFIENTINNYNYLIKAFKNRNKINRDLNKINLLEEFIISELDNLENGTEEEIIKTKRNAYCQLAKNIDVLTITHASLTKNPEKLNKCVDNFLKAANYHHKADKIIGYYTPLIINQGKSYDLAASFEQKKDPNSKMKSIYVHFAQELKDLATEKRWNQIGAHAFYKDLY